MSIIWSAIIIISLIYGMFFGSSENLMEIITNASMSSIENIITLTGMLCFWSGIFNILKNTKIITKLSKVIKPITSKLFKKEEITDEIMEDVALNVTSNAIGVGNAATAFSVSAISKMQKINKNKEKPNDSMTAFILLNTASIQIIPTSIISLRILYKSVAPTEILIPVWIVTITGLFVGIIAIKILNKVVK